MAGLAAIVLATAMPAGAAHAQVFKQFAQVEPAGVSDQRPAAPVVPDRLLLNALVGLRFVDNADAIDRRGTNWSGVSVEGNLAFLNDPEIKAKLAAMFVGKPLRTGDLARISAVVKDWYRAHSLPVVSVVFPQQPLTGGVLQAVVTVYKLGHVHVVGNQWFATSLLKAEMQLSPGEPIDFETLKDDLNRLNRNPFHRVEAILVRSQTAGDTDVELKVDDRFPLRVFASYDDEGAIATQRDRYSLGFTTGNVLALDQQISYQFTTSPDLFSAHHRTSGQSGNPSFLAHSASWLTPMPWGGFLNVFGSYAELVPDLGNSFGQEGHSLQLSGRYSRDLPALGSLSEQIQIGFDFKRTNNNLAFGGTQVFQNSTDIEQFLLIYDATIPDSLGQTAFENQVVGSPGGFSLADSTARYLASGVAGSNASYVYDHLQVTRLTYVPGKFTVFARAEGQIASSELLPSEQLGAGGVDTVRGYDLRAANGSQGVLASVELRSPTFSLLKTAWSNAPDTTQVLAFFDYGDVSYKDKQQGLPKSATLDSVGLGVRYTLSRHLDASFDYGWQLAKAPNETTLGSMATVSVSLSY